MKHKKLPPIEVGEVHKVKNWQDIEHLFDYKIDEVAEFYHEKGKLKVAAR